MAPSRQLSVTERHLVQIYSGNVWRETVWKFGMCIRGIEIRGKSQAPGLFYKAHFSFLVSKPRADPRWARHLAALFFH